jgi:hypothetical protein
VSLLLLLPVLAGMAALVITGIVRRSPPSREHAVTAARSHARLGSLAAVVLGAAAALWAGTGRLEDATGAGDLGVTALLVPIAFGVVHTAVLGVAELTWPRPEGAVRRARLAHRGLLDAAPRWLVRTATVAAAAAVLTLAGGALLAAPDGRSVTVEDAASSATASPFAGPVYGRPAALGLLVLAAVTAGALWVVADRAAVATDDDRAEAALRAASAHRVLRGATAATLTVTGGLLGVSGHAVWSVAASSGRDVLGLLGIGIAGCGLVALVAGCVLVCVRAPDVPADEPVAPA